MIRKVIGVKELLIIEDDKDIQELLKFFLEDNGYHVTIAGDGMEGIAEFHKKQFDLILLDIMLPKIDGYTVCELLRKETEIPIIIVTALTSEEDQIRGLDLQADDYITKPFSMPVLLRKISAVLRRSSGAKMSSSLNYRDLTLDVDNYRAYVKEKQVDLTKREFEILKELLENQGRILTREMLLERVWQYEFYGNDRVVDNHIKNLRKKLGVDYIETIKGVGYRIDKIH